MIYGLEDIKQSFKERNIRHTKDRSLRTGHNSSPRTFSMGHRTLTIHRIEYEQDIQRIRRSMLGLT